MCYHMMFVILTSCVQHHCNVNDIIKRHEKNIRTHGAFVLV